MKKSELEDIWSLKSRGLSPYVINQVLVPSGRGGKYNARDYVSALALLGEVLKVEPSINLRSVRDISDLYGKLDGPTTFRLRHYTPCLASRYDELSESKQSELFDSSDWVATQKMNGVRGWLFVVRDRLWLFSRNYSEVDCSLLEYSGNLLCGPVASDSVVGIDVEIVFEPGVDLGADLSDLGLATDSPLDAMVGLLHSDAEKALGVQRRYRERYGRDLVCMRMIAPLVWKGRNYVDSYSLGDGMDVYDEVLSHVQGLGLNVKGIPRCSGNRVEKEQFLNSILAIGGEGVVFHNRRGVYCVSENRSKESYVKLKRSVGGGKVVGMGDTIDAFVSGFKLGGVGTVNEGLVTTLEFSIWLNDAGEVVKKFIGAVSGLDMELKRAMSVECGGVYQQTYVGSDGMEHAVGLDPLYDGRVAELSGQALSSVNQRLEHPRLLRWCVERDMNSCVYTKEFLDSQTTNVGVRYGVLEV